MKKITRPKYTAIDTFIECIDKVKNADLKKRLTACKALILSAETELDSKITTGNIYSIKKESIINNNVTAKELEKVYTFRMAKKDTPGRPIYDKIISASELGICPLCNHRLVETLDHYLPKADFPRLTVTPINLIPACFPCNKGKLTTAPKNSMEETLHPYYDDLENYEWMFAKVNISTPATLTYYVNPPRDMPNLLRERTKHHFHAFSLNKLYSVQAAVLFRNLEGRLKNIYLKSGSLGVSKYLKEEADSRFLVDKNSWQTVFYKTLSQDNWFCNGGFIIA